MNAIDLLTNEIERESKTTQKILARIPEDKWDWQPHEKSSSLKKLATHIAQLATYPQIIATTEYLDFAEGTIQPLNIEKAAELVQFVEDETKKTVHALQQLDEMDLDKKWTLKKGGHVIVEGTKGTLLRTMGLSHLYHHRGQLSVYLRLLNVPIPGMYGPSADDQ